MANLAGELWRYNFAKLVVVDVTDDYRLMEIPLPSDFYPVLQEVYRPVHKLHETLVREDLVNGYLYDWHESPTDEEGCWYVGVVKSAADTFEEISLATAEA